MKNNKLLISLILILVFTMAFSLAQENQGGQFSKQGALYMDSGIIINTLVYDVVKVDSNMTVYMTPYELTGKTLDSTGVNCRVGIVNPDGSRLFLLENNINFTIIGEDDIWTATIPEYFLNETGEYLFNWDCSDNLRGGYFNSHVLVSIDGFQNSLPMLFSYIFILIGLGFLIFIVINNNSKTDFDDKRKKIVEGHNNMKKTLVKGVLLSLFKNVFIWVYFFGWFFVAVLEILINKFLPLEVYNYFEIFANIYSLGFILVLVFMIGFTIDFMKGIVDDISNDNWGIE